MAQILIIDDEPLARDTIRLILEGEGHDIVEAANGREGVEIDSAQPADVIITDLIMPEMDGIETIQHIRKMRPDAKIIAISGGARLKADIPLDLASKFGAMCVLPKPFGHENLVQTVRNCLG